LRIRWTKAEKKESDGCWQGYWQSFFLVCAFLIAGLIRQDIYNRELYENAISQFVNTVGNTVEPAQEAAPSAVPETGEAERPVITPVIPKREFPTMHVDFDKLLDVNEDIVGWLWIPGTDINYPVVQGESNYSYLGAGLHRREIERRQHLYGQPEPPDFSDPNTILFGHNMRSGRMFGSLKEFKEQEFVDEHRVFCVITPEGQFNYEHRCR
jgi:hypothetical protein